MIVRASTTDRIILDNTESARYVRLYIDSFTAENPDGDVTWNTISLLEMGSLWRRDPGKRK